MSFANRCNGVTVELPRNARKPTFFCDNSIFISGVPFSSTIFVQNRSASIISPNMPPVGIGFDVTNKRRQGGVGGGAGVGAVDCKYCWRLRGLILMIRKI